MAIQITNLSAKVIGVGNVTVLPGETKEAPVAFEGSPILETYKSMGLISLTGEKSPAVEAEAEPEEVQVDTEAIKKAKLESLKTASDEDVAALAKELGINPAECKDLADVRKKVKAALSK